MRSSSPSPTVSALEVRASWTMACMKPVVALRPLPPSLPGGNIPIIEM